MSVLLMPLLTLPCSAHWKSVDAARVAADLMQSLLIDFKEPGKLKGSFCGSAADQALDEQLRIGLCDSIHVLPDPKQSSQFQWCPNSLKNHYGHQIPSICTTKEATQTSDRSQVNDNAIQKDRKRGFELR